MSRGRKKRDRPHPRMFTDEQLDEIVDEFFDAGRVLMTEGAVRLVELILVYGCREDRGRPLRVTVDKLRRFVDWIFNQDLDYEDLEELPEVLPAWGRWAAERDGMTGEVLSRFRRDLLHVVDECERLLERRAAEVRAIRPYVEGVDMRDVATLDDVLERRGWAVPRPSGELDSLLDPSDPDDRRLFILSDHAECKDDFGVPLGQHLDDIELVTAQLWNNDPVQVWQAAAYCFQRFDRISVLHMLAALVARNRDDPAGYIRDLNDLMKL